MTKPNEAIEVVRGSGNVFADLGVPGAQLRQLKSILAAEIIKALDEEGLTVRKAEARTGIAAADFSRIRQVQLGRFTVDRLMNVLAKLDQHVDVQVTVRQGVVPSGHLARAQALPDSGFGMVKVSVPAHFDVASLLKPAVAQPFRGAKRGAVR